MKSTRLRRGIAALTIAVACLITMVNPAAAYPYPYFSDITSGSITLVKTGITPETISLTGTGTCSYADIAYLTLDVTGNTAAITSYSARTIKTFTNGPGTYLVDLTRSVIGNSPGSLWGTNITGMRLGVQMHIYSDFDPDTCLLTTTSFPICRLAFIVGLSGTVTGAGFSHTFSLTGSTIGSVVTYPSCTSGPSYLPGTTGTSSLTGHLW